MLRSIDSPASPCHICNAAEGAPTLTGTGSLFDEPVPTFGRSGVTSLVDLGHPVTMADVDVELKKSFRKVFGMAISE